MADERSPTIVADAIRAARGSRTQEWLGAEVAKVEGRKAPYGQNTVAGWESGRYHIKPHKVFVIERALGVPPGSISQLVGYLPTDATGGLTVPEAITADSELSTEQREDLLAVYEGMVARTRARRLARRQAAKG